jgi:hypothetical protein
MTYALKGKLCLDLSDEFPAEDSGLHHCNATWETDEGGAVTTLIHGSVDPEITEQQYSPHSMRDALVELLDRLCTSNPKYAGPLNFELRLRSEQVLML